MSTQTSNQTDTSRPAAAPHRAPALSRRTRVGAALASVLISSVLLGSVTLGLTGMADQADASTLAAAAAPGRG
jgi:hypothetical protein